MNDPIQVLHITAHLGGGVGNALSGLTAHSKNVAHTIVCLEQPEKLHFIEKAIGTGANICIAPRQKALENLISKADIVQLEWWGHPLVYDVLCKSELPEMRLLLWCHVSGIYTPTIPSSLIKSAHRCIYTSACSFNTPEFLDLTTTEKKRIGVIHSAGGIDEIPLFQRVESEPLTPGYIGTFNFAKLHPKFIEFLLESPVNDFRVNMIGDEANKNILKEQCQKANRNDLLSFKGYCNDIKKELRNINVMPYLLNPMHYGTTENALLEAMASKVVPIVLNNHAEKQIVKHLKTGIIIRSKNEFRDAIDWLHKNPSERLSLAENACKDIRIRFKTSKLGADMYAQYRALLLENKKRIPFNQIFGRDPSDWFLIQQRDPSIFSNKLEISLESEHMLVEKTKGSINHFFSYFGDNKRIGAWHKWLFTTR